MNSAASFFAFHTQVLRLAGLLAPLFYVLAMTLLAAFNRPALADIRETKHNLIKSEDKSVSEKQVCVFCHTPLNDPNDPTELPSATESASLATSGIAMSPRWQKSIKDGFVFTIYDDIGRLGLGKPSVGSASIACLSCHDSNQAFTVGRSYQDHPFGIPYRGATKTMLGGEVMRPKGDESAPFREALHLMNTEEFRDVSQGTVENRTVYWVSRNGVTARRSRNDLPLYGRVSNTGDPLADFGMNVPHIECSSCHDPHTKTQTFLRVPPEGSAVCLTCHDK